MICGMMKIGLEILPWKESSISISQVVGHVTGLDQLFIWFEL
jgi:hypothetical protein